MSSSDWLLGFFWCSREESALLPFYCRESHGTSQSRQLTVNESGSLFTVLFFSSRALNDDYREGPNVWMSELQSCSDYCIHSLAARVCMNVPFFPVSWNMKEIWKVAPLQAVDILAVFTSWGEERWTGHLNGAWQLCFVQQEHSIVWQVMGNVTRGEKIWTMNELPSIGEVGL